MTNGVESQLERIQQIHSELCAKIQGEFKDDARTMLLIAYTELVFEHHRGISQLVGNGLYGSAFALVRPLFEAFFRCHWMLKCATDGEAEEIATSDSFEFPKLRPMVEQIDKAYEAKGFFSDFLQGDAVKAMHSFTHGGLRALSRRFKGLNVEPDYRESEILEVLNATTVAILLMTKLFLLATDRQQEAEAVEDLAVEFGSS